MHDDVRIILIDFTLNIDDDSTSFEEINTCSEITLLFNNLKKMLQSARSRYSTKQIETFDDLPIRTELLRGIYSYGFEKMSDIQKKCILPIISSEPPVDVIVKSRVGTGKTASYSISAIQRLDLNSNFPNSCPQALVLVPSRELAWGVSKVIETLGSFLNINVMRAIGGESVKKSMDELSTRTVHVMVGTPGRVLDLIKKRVLNVKFLKILIMDELDDLLERGFKDQIYQIVNSCMKINLQICLFGYLSNSEETNEFYQKVLRNPVIMKEKPLANCARYL